MTRYEKGFITKCEEYGIDGAALLKRAAESEKPEEKSPLDSLIRDPYKELDDMAARYGISKDSDEYKRVYKRIRNERLRDALLSTFRFGFVV